MEQHNQFNNIAFDLPKNRSNVIKVIGVGGGGSNAINHMFQSGIKGVDFVVCNTDAQALHNSPVPNKIQLGVSLTEGLGAGANPEVGEQAALESMEDIKALLAHTTKMVFITAGMGGGTGTGAAPVIAKLAKELDILTVGIVTIPFQFEGSLRNKQAQTGIEKLRANVDSLIVINNNKLREVYGNLGFKAGFSKADEVLATAAKGIAEVITHHYTQNIDLRDAKTVLANSGTAIMGSATAAGSVRADEAITHALDSPLLNDNKIKGAQNVLLLIISGAQEITIDEIGEINDHIQREAGHGANIIMGIGEDPELGDAIAVTVIATGFHADQQNQMVNTEVKKIFYTLEDEQTAAHDLTPEATAVQDLKPQKQRSNPQPPIIKYTLTSDNEDRPTPTKPQKAKSSATPDYIKHLQVVYEMVAPQNTQNKTGTKEKQPNSSVAERDSSVAEHNSSLEEHNFSIAEHNFSVAERDSSVAKCNSSVAERDSSVAEYNSSVAEHNSSLEERNSSIAEHNSSVAERDSSVAEHNSSVAEHNSSLEEPNSKLETSNLKPQDDQFTLHFDLPLPKVKEQAPPSVPLEEEQVLNTSDVETHIQPQPTAESDKPAEIRYKLEEYMALENQLTQAKPIDDTPMPQVAEEALEYTTKTLPPDDTSESEPPPAADPLNSSINDLLKSRAEERRKKLKEFNYKFQNRNASIDQIEKQPAYKRQGVDLNETPKAQQSSRTTLSEDSNDDLQLRSNNSFLHDNVD